MAAKTGTIKVMGEGQDLGEIQYPIFTTVQEAVDELKAEQVLEFLNTQVRTSFMNAHRQKFTAKLTKARVKELAFAKIAPEEFAGAAGDSEKINALVEKYSKIVEAEYAEAKKTTQTAETSASGGGTEEDTGN